MNEGVVLPLLDESMCVLESLTILAVLERVGQETDLREGQGTKNTGRVNTSDTKADAPVSSCRSEINIKTRETRCVGHSNDMVIVCFYYT